MNIYITVLDGMKTKIFAIYSLIFAFGCLVGNLHAAPLPVAFLRMPSQDVSAVLERTINEVVFSFTGEIKNYSVQDFGNTSEKIVVSSPDILYIFTGKILGFEDGVRLELCFKNRNLEIVRYLARDYEGTNKILLESRLLVKELFETRDDIEVARLSFEASAKSSPKKEKQMEDIKNFVEKEFKNIYTVDALAGAWYGEDGEIEKIMIMRGGRGVAIWVSGISLLLDVKLEDGILVISQKGMPQPRQFVNLPDNIASLAAKTAKPIVWQFSVDENLKVLSGLKKTSLVQYMNDKIVSISEVAVPAVWHRN